MTRNSEEVLSIKDAALDGKAVRLLEKLNCRTLKDFLEFDTREIIRLKDGDWDSFFALKKAQEKLRRQHNGIEPNSRPPKQAKPSSPSSQKADQLTLEFAATEEIPDPTTEEPNATIIEVTPGAVESAPLLEELESEAVEESVTEPPYSAVLAESNALPMPSKEELAAAPDELRLYYQAANSWVRLPTWANLLTEVGSAIGNLFSQRDKRCFIVLALPTRSFAAPFVLMGLLSYLAAHKTTADANQHFEILKRLKHGARLRIVRGTTWQTGLFLGIERAGGETRIKVRTRVKKGGGQVEWYSKAECLALEPAEKSAAQGNGSASARIKHKTFKHAGFARLLLADANLDEFSLRSTFDCLVIAGDHTFKKAIVATPFAALKKRSFHVGCLQDVVRVREFLPPGHVYHSSSYSLRSEKLKEMTSNENLGFVVYDGASSVLKWQASFPKSHAVILLDQTENHFEEACANINNYYMNRLEDDDLPQFPKMPKGVELVAFWK